MGGESHHSGHHAPPRMRNTAPIRQRIHQAQKPRTDEGPAYCSECTTFEENEMLRLRSLLSPCSTDTCAACLARANTILSWIRDRCRCHTPHAHTPHNPNAPTSHHTCHKTLFGKVQQGLARLELATVLKTRLTFMASAACALRWLRLPPTTRFAAAFLAARPRMARLSSSEWMRSYSCDTVHRCAST